MQKPLPLPSGMTQAQLREHAEQAIAQGAGTILVNTPDLLQLLVQLDLRQRLDPDVRACASTVVEVAQSLELDDDDHRIDHITPALVEAAQRVLKHEPKPDLSGAPS